MRRPAPRVKPRLSKSFSFPAPVDGWIKNVNLATPTGRKPDGSKVVGAAMLENIIPTATGNRMRGGSNKYATIGAGSGNDVRSLFTYVNGSNQKLFGADDAGIYDISTVVDADVSPAASVSGMTSGNWCVVQFATAGGTFLRAVNGADTPQVYDGTTWSALPALTGVTASTLSNVWVFKNRLFFIQSGSLDAYYLAVDSIGGALTKLPLGGVFVRGGSLLFGYAWSTETGAGLSEQCIFVSTEGEVAVYQGSDPGSSSTWSKVGVYRIGKPLGAKAFFAAGGDIAIATDIGLIPLSQAISRDVAALAPASVSYPIETAWNEEVTGRSTDPWHCATWPTKQMALIALPTKSNGSTLMFVANARTGAWGSITGWDGKCLTLFGTRLFFGSADGKVVEAEVTGADQGAPYTATVIPLFDPMKTPASLKTGLQARAVIRAPTRVEAKLSLQKDFRISLPAAPDDIVVPADDRWGTGVWGTSRWGTPSTKTTFQDWQSCPGSGYSISIATQITSAGVSPPDVEFVQTDFVYDVGDVGT